MADFSIAAQVGQNAMAPQQGQSNMFNPMNMLQMQQTMQAIALQRAADARAQQQLDLTRRSTEQSMGIAASAEERAKALHAPSLANANLTLESNRLTVDKAKREEALRQKTFDWIKTAADPYDPEAVKGLRTKDPELYTAMSSKLQDMRKLTAEADEKTTEALTKKFNYVKSAAPMWLANINNIQDQKTYSAAYADLVAANPSIKNLIPPEYSPENVKMMERAFTGVANMGTIKVGEATYITRNGIPVFEMDPTAPGHMRPLTPQETQSISGTPAPAGAAAAAAQPAGPGPANAMATGMLRQFEGFSEQPYWDRNAYRGGHGSDTVTTADGRVVRVEPGMTISRQDAERDLARRTGEFASRAAAQAGQAWANLPPNAQAALTSIAYNYGSLPERILGAVRSGNPDAIARAVEGLAGDNYGVNFNRRMQEAAIIRGGAVPATTASPLLNAQPNAPQMMAANAMVPQMMAANAMAPQMAPPQNAMAAPAVPTPAPMPVTQQPSNLPPEPRREQFASYGEYVSAKKKWDELDKADRTRREKLEDEAIKRDAELAKAKELKKFETGLKPGVEEKAAEVRATTRAKADVERELEGEKDVSNTAKTLSEIRGILAPGGLLERSTGSGLGRLVDATTGFFGYATEGAKAAAALKPIADIALKQVPRFEGPQSDADRQSYVEASGAAADASLPNEVRRAALQTMERLLVKHQKYLTEKGRGQPPETYQYYEGQTATDPKTGARVVFQNNQWVPLK